MAYTEKWSKTLDATKDVQKLCDEMKSQVERKTDEKYEEFKAVKYRELTNVRYGFSFNWLIKVDVGGRSYIHLYVFQEVGGKPTLVGVEQNKTKDDPIEPFHG